MNPLSILALIKANWKLAAGAVVGLVLIGLVGALSITRSTLASRTIERDQARQALADQQNAIRAKTAQAQADDQAHAQAVEASQDKVTTNVSTDYQQQLVALRARYDSLLANAAKANPGRSGAASVPSVPDSAGRADGAAPEAGLPAPDALIASQQALQLQALQGWVRGQQAVER